MLSKVLLPTMGCLWYFQLDSCPPGTATGILLTLVRLHEGLKYRHLGFLGWYVIGEMVHEFC